MTVIAVTLALFFGIGRFMGMTGSEIFTLGLMRFAFSIPMLIVWTVGLTMSVSRQRQQPAFFWATLAFAGFIVTTLASALVSMLIQRAMLTSAPQSISIWFTVQGLVSVLLNAACWVLLFIALFSRQRKVEQVWDAEAASPAE